MSTISKELAVQCVTIDSNEAAPPTSCARCSDGSTPSAAGSTPTGPPPPAIHTPSDVAKALLVDADVTMLASALLRHGPAHLSRLEHSLQEWMCDHDYDAMEQLEGSAGQQAIQAPHGVRTRDLHAGAERLRHRPPDLTGPTREGTSCVLAQ